MNSAYISAIAALAGSGIGAVASFATTWLTQDAQHRARRFAKAVTRRERLFGEFIEEASKLLTDALTHQLDGRLRLSASANVITEAEQVLQHIVETYHLPNRDFRNPEDRHRDDVDVLRAFSEACREDLQV
jgi:hypothetical protein